ncbi:MAG: SpoIIE family protein phosphatase [Bacillota bacterium]
MNPLKKTNFNSSIETEILNGLLEKFPEAMYIKDISHKFIAINKQAAKNFASSTDEIIGKTDFDILPQMIAKKSWQEEKYVLQNGEPIHTKKLINQKNWSNITRLPLKNSQGEIIGILGINQPLLGETNNNSSQLTFKDLLKTDLIPEIEKGQKIYNNFFSTPANSDWFEIATYHQVANIIGGDMYNFVEVDDKLIGYITDVTGHGIDSSFLNVFLRVIIDNFLSYKYQESCSKKISPKDILSFVQEKYHQEKFPPDYFICIGLFVLNKKTQQLTYSHAGFHIPPIIVCGNSKKTLEIKGFPISSLNQNHEFQEKSCKLDSNCGVLLTTNGLIEERKGTETYGQEKLIKSLDYKEEFTAQDIIDQIEKKFREFKSIKNDEDLTVNDDITTIFIKPNFPENQKIKKP